MCFRCVLAPTQQLSQLVAEFGKDIVEYIWKEQNLFSSKRKWEVLFYFSFFSSLIGLCVQIFLYCHLNWIDRDNLLFFIPGRKNDPSAAQILLRSLGVELHFPSRGALVRIIFQSNFSRRLASFMPLPSISSCIPLEFFSKSMCI